MHSPGFESRLSGFPAALSFSEKREPGLRRGNSCASLAPRFALPCPRFIRLFVLRRVLVALIEKNTTSNGGPLGSCIDEERSKLRYLV